VVLQVPVEAFSSLGGDCAHGEAVMDADCTVPHVGTDVVIQVWRGFLPQLPQPFIPSLKHVTA